jgi:hypothetical protein
MAASVARLDGSAYPLAYFANMQRTALTFYSGSARRGTDSLLAKFDSIGADGHSNCGRTLTDLITSGEFAEPGCVVRKNC